MRIDWNTLMNDLVLLSQKFYKVIEVNLKDDTYFEVKIDEREPHIYHSIQKWVSAFSETGVHPEDKNRFLQFFNPFLLADNAEKNWQRVYYRRKMNDSWRWVCMEVIPVENFDKDDPIVLIVVRDVEDYIRDYHAQVGYDYKEAAND